MALALECEQMRKAAERRLLVMVNVHRTIATAWPGEGLWYDGMVSESQAIASWTALATKLCKHWNFFAADLVNEPFKASWGRGKPTDWNKAAERIGNAVLGACPRLLIFVQGVAGDPGAQGDGGVDQGYFCESSCPNAAPQIHFSKRRHCADIGRSVRRG